MVIAVAMIFCGHAVAHPKPGAHADVRVAIDDQEVRFDCLMNILFVDQLVRSRQEVVDRVSDEEATSLATALSEYFGGSRSGPVTALLDRPNRVLIDDVEVAPLIRVIEIVRPEQESRPGFVPNPVLLLPQVHVRVSYPCKSMPKSVRMQWGTFPRDFTRLEGDTAPVSEVEATLSSPGAFDVIRFSRSEPEFIWHATAARPPTLQIATASPQDADGSSSRSTLMAGVGLLAASGVALLARPGRRRFGAVCIVLSASVAAAGLIITPRFAGEPTPPDDDRAVAIFTALHDNIYRAFDYAREGEIFDALARSVDGPLLGVVYEQVYRDLIMQEEGGAVARVRSVHVTQASVRRSAAPGDLLIAARWTVEGVVYHWGHSHRRVNEYEADYTMAIRQRTWKIIGLAMRAQRRLETDPKPAGSVVPVGTSGVTSPSEQQPWKPDR